MRTPLAGPAGLITVISSTDSSIAISTAQDWSTTPYLLTSCAGVLGSTRLRSLPGTLRISPSAFAPPCLLRGLEYNKAILHITQTAALSCSDVDLNDLLGRRAGLSPRSLDVTSVKFLEMVFHDFQRNNLPILETRSRRDGERFGGLQILDHGAEID